MRLMANGALALFQSALYQTSSAVIMTNDLVLIVDPCWLPHEVEAIRQYVNEHAGDRRRYLLFTHSDYDHIIGYGAFPEAKVVASRELADKPEAGRAEILEQIRSFDDEYYITRSYDTVYPVVDLAVERDGQELQAGSTTLTFYQSPGHTSDGLFTVVEPAGVLLAGDYVSDLEFPFIDHSSVHYEATLHKLERIMEENCIHTVVPGHGSAAQDKAEISRRISKDLAYISSMRGLTAAGDEDGIEHLIDGCPFPRNLAKFHQLNRKRFEAELAAQHTGIEESGAS
jgi:hydroxyacylglutathione hydrolase